MQLFGNEFGTLHIHLLLRYSIFMIKDNTPLWSPSKELIQQSNMLRYMEWLKKEKQLYFRKL